MSSPRGREKDPIKLVNSRQIEFDLSESSDFVLVPRETLERILKRLKVIEEEPDRWQVSR